MRVVVRLMIKVRLGFRVWFGLWESEPAGTGERLTGASVGTGPATPLEYTRPLIIPLGC